MVTLSKGDLNAIKAIRDLASSSSDTYIVIESTLVRDKTGNTVVPITSTSAKQLQHILPIVHFHSWIAMY